MTTLYHFTGILYHSISFCFISQAVGIIHKFVEVVQKIM